MVCQLPRSGRLEPQGDPQRRPPATSPRIGPFRTILIASGTLRKARESRRSDVRSAGNRWAGIRPTDEGERRRPGATVLILNKAFSDGRLTNAEHEQRMTAAYAAVTMGDPTKLTADLPTMSAPPPPPGPPATSAHTPTRSVASTGTRRCGLQWLSWLGLSLFMIAIWLISGFSKDGFEFWLLLAVLGDRPHWHLPGRSHLQRRPTLRRLHPRGPDSGTGPYPSGTAPILLCRSELDSGLEPGPGQGPGTRRKPRGPSRRSASSCRPPGPGPTWGRRSRSATNDRHRCRASCRSRTARRRSSRCRY